MLIIFHKLKKVCIGTIGQLGKLTGCRRPVCERGIAADLKCGSGGTAYYPKSARLKAAIVHFEGLVTVNHDVLI